MDPGILVTMFVSEYELAKCIWRKAMGNDRPMFRRISCSLFCRGISQEDALKLLLRRGAVLAKFFINRMSYRVTSIVIHVLT